MIKLWPDVSDASEAVHTRAKQRKETTMGNGKRILAGSVLALAATGIVTGAAVSAFANGPNSEWAGPDHAVLASEWVGPTTTVSNPTAVEYATSKAAGPASEWTGPAASLSNPTAVEYA
jgi:hypothetical protein